MYQKFVRFCVIIVQKYLPDPFLFAVILTIITLFLGVVFTAQNPIQMIHHWGDGFWGLLTFAMQMVLILLLGHTLAQATIIKKGLSNLARLPKTAGGAIIMVTIVSAVTCWINWGLGLVTGALLAKELAKNVKVDYRLLVASAYSGYLLWHAGLSGSIPLSLATPSTNFAVITGGAVIEPISTTHTIFAGFNVAIALYSNNLKTV